MSPCRIILLTILVALPFVLAACNACGCGQDQTPVATRPAMVPASGPR